MTPSRVLAAIAAVIVGSSALSAVPAAAAPPIGIGVAPTANGFVMWKTPTQITVSGIRSAKVYEKVSTQWTLVGRLTAKAPSITHTFAEYGIRDLKVVPSNGKAKTFKVPVYAVWADEGDKVLTFGSEVLQAHAQALGRREYAASRGCVLITIGITDYGKYGYNSYNIGPYTVSVVSTGKPPFLGGPVDRAGTIFRDIPVEGSIILTVTSDDTKYRGNYYGERLFLTCLTG